MLESVELVSDAAELALLFVSQSAGQPIVASAVGPKKPVIPHSEVAVGVVQAEALLPDEAEPPDELSPELSAEESVELSVELSVEEAAPEESPPVLEPPPPEDVSPELASPEEAPPELSVELSAEESAEESVELSVEESAEPVSYTHLTLPTK